MKRNIIALCAFGLLLLSGMTVQADNTAKAKFIFDLFDDVEWPAGSGNDNNIYVIGESPLTGELEKLASSNSTDSRKFSVKKIAVDDDFTGCRILLIASSDLGDLAKVLKKVKGTSILTVSDIDGFARYGVMINVLEKSEKSKGEVGLVINKMTAREAGIKIDEGLIKKADKTFG